MTPGEKIRRTLAALPDAPGVYLMRDRAGTVIYVGKAASLRSRVRSYFQRGTYRRADPKLRGLLAAVESLETVPLRTAAEAALIEGQFIKDYRPRFNIEFKDDKRFLLLKLNLREPFPRASACRLRKDDGAVYFGPYASAAAARAALEFVETRYGLRVCRPRAPGPEDHRHCHADILRRCSAPCIGRSSPADYRARAGEAAAFLRGERPGELAALREAMQAAARELQYERAAALRDTLRLLDAALRQRARAALTPERKGERARQGVADLQAALDLPRAPRAIECYDISNLSGTLAVGSGVCAVDGLPDRRRYRRFRIRTVAGSDDPAMMAEVLARRFARAGEANWQPPDLVLVDGGLTQLRAARTALAALGFPDQPTAALAKQREEIYAGPPGAERIVNLPDDSEALRVLTRLRDEAHRFAIAYHRRLRARRIRESALDDIAGVGPARKAQLLRHFGSLARLRCAAPDELAAAAPGLGAEKAKEILERLGRTIPAGRDDA